MTLQDWGALGELIGGAAIIVSLVYVGLQIKQSTQATRASASHAFTAQYSDLLLQLTRADLRDIWWRGVRGLHNLQGSETTAFMAFLAAAMRFWESFFLQTRDGTFDSRIFDAWRAQLVDLFSNEGVREYWAISGHQYTAEFVEFIDELIASSAPKPVNRDTAR